MKNLHVRNFLNEMMVQINNRNIKEFRIKSHFGLIIEGKDMKPESLYNHVKNILKKFEIPETFEYNESEFYVHINFYDSTWLILKDTGLYHKDDEDRLIRQSFYDWVQYRQPTIFDDDYFEIDPKLKERYSGECNHPYFDPSNVDLFKDVDKDVHLSELNKTVNLKEIPPVGVSFNRVFVLQENDLVGEYVDIELEDAVSTVHYRVDI